MYEYFSKLRLKALVKMHKSSVKLNDVSQDFNFQRENKIYVAHITSLKAVILFKMLLLYSLGIQHANYIRNLNNKMV